MNSTFVQAFVYLGAAVVAVPFAKRLGLGSVLGYLLAGVAIGPFGLKLVGGGHDVMSFAEFGVVMMLFLIGLELRPSLLWQLRKPILGLGGAQVVVTSLAAAGAALALGVDLKQASAIGMILSLSSTAIVLQSLTEKGLLKGEGGQASFSVLLFQDIAVIPMLALFPLLRSASVAPVAEAAAHGASRPGWQQALMVLGAVVGIVLAGRYLVQPAFRLLATTQLRELFTAASLFLVVGIALLMHSVGLSPALGTFLAGVVLAESEYRHELESDIEPFKGLLLGLFFISVGVSIDFALIAARPGGIAALVAGLIVVKGLVLYALARVFGISRAARAVFAFSLAQGGEFAFVLFSFALQNGVLKESIASTLVAVVALSMLLTPLLLMALERLVLPRITERDAERPADSDIQGHDGNIVIAGFGRFGQIAGRLLRAGGAKLTILDVDPSMVDVLSRVGIKVYYGDASRLDLLQAAGCANAKLFVLAVDDVEQSLSIARTVRHNYPNLKIFARARNRAHFYDLHALGIEHIYRETFGSSLEMGTEILHAMGIRAHRAHLLARAFRRQDEAALMKLAELWGKDDNAYFAAAKQASEESEQLLRSGLGKGGHSEVDGAWDPESLRADFGRFV